LAAGGAAVLSAASWRRVLGANERIGVGLIGFGLIGKRHAEDFRAQPDAELVAVAETHGGRLQEALALAGTRAQGHGDFRRLLDDPRVDVVVVSTPDHWHALPTMLACAAGKDVYVEKPLSLFVREGRWMADVARRHGRIVQVGTQQRSGPHYGRARELIRQGRLGKVHAVRMAAYRNIMPGYGRPPDGRPPAELDWPLWLGPAPERPYNANRAIYHFRWFWDYSGGQMTNLGAHALDIVDWFLEPGPPTRVASFGGRFALEDNGETPDTQDALIEYPGLSAVWSHREAAAGARRSTGLEFFGTQGSLAISRKGFTLSAERPVPPDSSVPQFGGQHPAGGPVTTARTSDEPLALSRVVEEDKSGDARAQFRLHARDFLDCVRSRRQPVSDLESAHRVATAAHLANLSLRLGRSLRWDGAQEQIVGDAEAAAMLARPYRAPWDRELSALGVT
jgi:predicted dehydrogenase